MSEQCEKFVKRDEGVEGEVAKQDPLHAIHGNQGPTHMSEGTRSEWSAKAQSPRYVPQDGWQNYGRNVRHVGEDDGRLH